MRVLCLVTLPTSGAGNRLRVEQYAPRLRGLGVALTVSPFFDEATYAILYRPGHGLAKVLGGLRGAARRLRDLVRSFRYDLVLVYRESAPIGPPLFERFLTLAGRRYVYDFDDALFLAPTHPVNRRWGFLRGPSRYAETARRAVAVVTVNAYLAEWARTHNRDVTVIATPVDTERFRPRAAPRPAGPIVLGWTGSGTTAPYLKLLDEPFERLGRELDLALRVVGGSYEHPRVRVEARPWSLDREPEDVAGFDVGLLPEPDDEWTKGKGAFKALLYMACGVPVVASRVGVNEEIVEDGVVGYCVDGEDGWVVAIRTLARDAALRERLGSAGRRRVEERYSIDALAPRLAAVLKRAAS